MASEGYKYICEGEGCGELVVREKKHTGRRVLMHRGCSAFATSPWDCRLIYQGRLSERELFIDALVETIGKRKDPILLNDLLENMRRDDWTGIPKTWTLEQDLMEQGMAIRTRRHGSGLAVYVWNKDFTQVINGRDKLVDVYR